MRPDPPNKETQLRKLGGPFLFGLGFLQALFFLCTFDPLMRFLTGLSPRDADKLIKSMIPWIMIPEVAVLILGLWRRSNFLFGTAVFLLLWSIFRFGVIIHWVGDR